MTLPNVLQFYDVENCNVNLNPKNINKLDRVLDYHVDVYCLDNKKPLSLYESMERRYAKSIKLLVEEDDFYT